VRLLEQLCRRLPKVRYLRLDRRTLHLVADLHSTAQHSTAQQRL
jgi:hypothetical protein